MNHSNVVLAAIVLGASLLGCQASTPSVHSSLPDRAYLVGGGFQVDYTAPTAGTAIVADATSGKYLMTKSMKANEQLSFSLDPREYEEYLANILGDDPSKVHLELYFVPPSD